jgi:hypothetical protein
MRESAPQLKTIAEAMETVVQSEWRSVEKQRGVI